MRYRKVSVQIWSDEKFRSLSHYARFAFIYLLTCPNMLGIGCMRATVNGLATELATLEVDGQFDQCFEGYREGLREAISKGLVVCDPKASFICLPNFIKHNMPENPKVVIGWRRVIDLIPQCDTQRWYFQEVKRHLSQFKGLSEAFKGFMEGFPKAYAEGYDKGYREGYAITGTENREQRTVITPLPPEGGKEGELVVDNEGNEIPPPPSPTISKHVERPLESPESEEYHQSSSVKAMARRQGLPLPPPALSASPEFMTAWADWLGYLDRKGAPMDRDTAPLVFEDLVRWGVGKSLELFQYAKKCGWRSLHESSSNGNGTTHDWRARKAAQECAEPKKRNIRKV